MSNFAHSLTRRALLATGALLAGTAPGLAQGTGQGGDDPRLGERTTGQAGAPVRVLEFFSLTCGHCATFHRETWPQVKRELVDTGAIQMVWWDFPLDQLALAGAAVARSLPPERYEGFIGALLNSQERWAFTRGDQMGEMARIAAVAGMSRPKFDEVVADDRLKRAILERRLVAERDYAVSATPSFSFQGMGQGTGQSTSQSTGQGTGAPRSHSGAIPFDRFKQLVEEARRG
jgi:protein-disulfide isomerase